MSDGVRPRDCVCPSDVRALNESHKFAGKYSMLIQHDSAVVLWEQERGKPAGPTVTIPRKQFQVLLDWYDLIQAP